MSKEQNNRSPKGLRLFCFDIYEKEDDAIWYLSKQKCVSILHPSEIQELN